MVGRNPSPHLRQKLAHEPAIDLIGWVDDVRPFIARHAVYIVPLRIGGGTRIKIYEAMAMGKAIVSTPIGAEGLPVEHGRHIWLADEAEPFAEAVIHLLQDRAARQQVETAAREFVERHCSWDRAAAVFADICRQVAEG
ncbi:glycosyltransferase [Candidatus Entotheonella palauensis]|uniref:glycosyltransferase n=1 Tax=Candidatus Entotheonella palauensis TaxID=93172 RepID=UPI000B7E985D|nr:glycosyltransferase [Candidatus Entotheonella palauensis]